MQARFSTFFRFVLNLRPAVNLLLMLALCCVVTWWSLQWLSARPIESPPEAHAAVVEPATGEALPALFGSLRNEHQNISNVQVIGVIADRLDGSGVALLSIDGQPSEAVRSGAPFGSALVLREVRRDHVVLERNGVREEVRLPEIQSSKNVMPPGILSNVPPGVKVPLHGMRPGQANIPGTQNTIMMPPPGYPGMNDQPQTQLQLQSPQQSSEVD